MRVIIAQIKNRGTLPDNLPRFQEIEFGAYVPAIVAADGTLTCTPDAAPHPGDCLVDRLTGRHLIAQTGYTVVDRRGNDVYIDTPTIPAQLFTLQRFDMGTVNAFGRPAEPEPQAISENVPVHIATYTPAP